MNRATLVLASPYQLLTLCLYYTAEQGVAQTSFVGEVRFTFLHQARETW